MNPYYQILFKSLVKPFYRENAGLFTFVFTMLFFIVNKVDGAEWIAYHYSLIRATLESGVVLVLVLGIWAIYTRKCTAYVTARLYQPAFSFLALFNALPKRQRWCLFLWLQCWLLLPILLYALLIVTVGLYQHFYIPVLIIVLFFLLSISLTVQLPLTNLARGVPEAKVATNRLDFWRQRFSHYPIILLAYLFRHQFWQWLALKAFTCGMLYLIARNNSIEDYDLQPTFFFFNFGIMAHVLLLVRMRAFEETTLSFYKGSPVTLTRRWFQYAVVYAVALVPEFLTLAFLVPVHLLTIDGVHFALCGYSFLVFLNGLTFTREYVMKDLLKLLSLAFFIQYLILLTIGLLPIWVLFFGISVFIFRTSYLNFERLQ